MANLKTEKTNDQIPVAQKVISTTRYGTFPSSGGYNDQILQTSSSSTMLQTLKNALAFTDKSYSNLK